MIEENLTKEVSNIKYDKAIIFTTFEEIFFKESNIELKKFSYNVDTSWRQYDGSFDDKQYSVYLKFKNVTSGGWADKPQIRRIQIARKHLEGIVETKENELSMLVGFLTFKNSPIFCFWNPKRYITHKTVCSCYVNVSSINKAFTDGYYFGHDSGKEVYICNSLNLQRVIKEYINNNYVSSFKW